VGRRLIGPNQEFTVQLHFSEVCMHLRVAGTRMRARLEQGGMVQLLDPDGSPFSFPITAGEAGLDHDPHHGWYLETDDPPDQPTGELPAGTEPGQPHPPVLDAIGQPLAIGDRHTWRGDVIDGPGGPLYWHPVLGYVSVPDPDPDPDPDPEP
jgi:hypothetical protein